MKNASQVATVFNNLCSSCLFCEKDKDIVDSCKAGVLKRLSKATNPTEFCTLHRPEEIELGDSSVEEFLENAIKVCSAKYGVIVFDESDNSTDVVKTIESIIDCNYPKNRIKVVLSVEEQKLLERGSSIGEYLQHYYRLGGSSILCELTFHRPNMPPDVMETEVFQKIVDSSHFVNVNAGNIIEPEMFNYIEEKRSSMEKVILCTDEEQDITCIPKSVAQSFYLNFNDYRNMIKALREEAINTDTYFKYEKSK